MVSQQVVQQQLHALGIGHKFAGRAELRELKNILVPQETIQVLLNGFYTGGFATMIATDKRILIVDKKPFVLNIEDLRYDMISEVTFESKVLDAQVRITLPQKSVHFRSWHQPALRQLSGYIQERVMETYADWQHRQRRYQSYQQTAVEAPQLINVLPPSATADFPTASAPRFRLGRTAHSVLIAASRMAIRGAQRP